jgi:TonB family protein
MNALDYFLKANLYGLLFAGCYWLLLRRHTFFGLNRAYLILSVLLSLTLPLVSLPAETVETLPVPVGVIALPIATAMATPPVETGPDWELVGTWAYGIVALGLLARLLIRAGSLLWLIQRSPRQAGEGYVLVQVNDPKTPTFSFFHYIVLNPADISNDLILKHELIHVRQMHSVDVIGLAVLRTLFWACPALWLLDRLLRQVHEFIADQHTDQPTHYARFLVEYSFGLQPSPLTNGFFNPSLLKQRIQMLHRSSTTRWALTKYTLIIPVAFALLAMTTAREQFTNVVSQVTDETIIVSGRVTNAVDGKPLSGAHVGVATTGKGTTTDRNGFYTLTDVPIASRITYSHLGYRMDVWRVESLGNRIKNNALTLNPKLTTTLEDELPAMGSTAMYKSVKPNPVMQLATPSVSQTINGKVFKAVEEKAVFPTGIPGLMQYVAHNLRYPAKAKVAGIEGDVYVIFTILPTGAVGEAKVNKTIERIGGGCEEEAIRVVRNMPKWIPARQNGKPVAVQYQLPIRFALEKEARQTGQVTPTVNTTGTSKNKAYALYEDGSSQKIAYPDSNPTNYRDTVKTQSRLFQAAPSERTSKERYSMPLPNRYKFFVPAKAIVPQGTDNLFLLNGTKQIGSIEGVNSKDIESIDVYKDEQTIAKYKLLYGDKAWKGVVIIHLKSANVL